MKIIIVEDESRTRKSIAKMLELLPVEATLVAEADSVQSGLKAIRQYSPDVVLLDINMSDGTGFDLLKKLNSDIPKVIFITAYEEYAVQAFEFSAIDYLLKPVDPAKLSEAFRKARLMVDSENLSLRLNALFANLDDTTSDSKKLVLKTAENIYLITTSDIIRCESDGGYTRFFTVDGRKIMVSRNMKDYEEMLDGFGFYRIHQSHLINLRFIDHYSKTDGGAVVMKDNTVLPLARRKKESFLNLLEML
ncbi:MAG: LytTR family DNA-binding domain-containing protein [Bacteroidales bacterium]